MYKKIENSSNVERVAYDEKTSTLQVQYKGGKLYNYLRVTIDKWEELIASDSAGSYVSNKIKNQHDWIKTTEVIQ